MAIKSRSNTKDWYSNYDKVFGKKNKIQSIDNVDKLDKHNKKINKKSEKYDVVDRLDNVIAIIVEEHDDEKPVSAKIKHAVKSLEQEAKSYVENVPHTNEVVEAPKTIEDTTSVNQEVVSEIAAEDSKPVKNKSAKLEKKY